MDIIDLGTDVVIDRSKIRDPYTNLMVAAIGEALVQGPPWVAVDKRLASRCSFPLVPSGAKRSARRRSRFT
jgi:hypothetical protein